MVLRGLCNREKNQEVDLSIVQDAFREKEFKALSRSELENYKKDFLQFLK